ncbi:MAG TPA: hypothetical protein VN088_16465 [Nocardioides sp.]|nr:hypothetical protein [Nocardioides sp.]
MNGTGPFGELILDGDRVTVRFVGPLQRWTRARELSCRPADVDLVFPSRDAIFRLRNGIGFRTLDGVESYFWTHAGRAILGLLAACGFPVTSEVRTARQVGWWVRRG